MKEILISVGILGSLILVAYFLPFDPCSEIMQKTIVIAKVFLALGVILAAFQFYFNQQQLKNNNSWNKSQLAITEINKINTKLEPSIKKLRKELEYGERKEPYKVSELHDKFGKFENNGKKFVFYKNDENKKFSDGRDIKDTIINLLNNFEYIATGINLNIFDEEVVKKLWKSKLPYAYKMFESYINHLRTEHGWGNVYVEMENLIKKWEKES
jgi:hypothetical protein